MLYFSFFLSDNQAQINGMAASNVMPTDSARDSEEEMDISSTTTSEKSMLT